jgi:3-oxoacyl-[acyl-carrier protein] reductase
VDLGISGRKAIVCASSRGLGLACAVALAREGCEVVINGRTPEALERALEHIRSRADVVARLVVADLNTEEGRAQIIAACPDPDILINNNGGPAPGNWWELEREDWMRAIEANMLAPILLIKAFVPRMRARKFGRVVNITSAMVKAPRAHMGLSTAARAGLTAFSKAVSLEVARDNVTINNLLPGSFDTDRLAQTTMASARSSGRDIAELRRERAAEIPAGRFGTIEEFGHACAFLCSAHAGYITGLNLLIDGGNYPGTF